ncbi:MAG: hypothetical protein GY750_04485 [Lentisphaerae bacterium]|nr:hypothetical protein [Lentisphaerota bacterium]MCP4100668.1 hypothetical protein [Lentisphaerota bacterium]
MFLARIFGLIRSHYMLSGGILIAIAIVIALIFIIRKIRRKAKPAPKAVSKGPKNVFKIYFRSFKKCLPWRLRLALTYRKHYLYLNCAGDDLVRKCTDVERYAYEYYPEYAADKDYNFYITSNIFINEINKSLVLDNSSVTNKKLTKFWRKIFSHQKPIVIVSIDHHEITEKPTEEHMELQLAIRKKLNILSKLFGSPVRVYFSLANMNKEEGYECFINFLEASNYKYFTAITEDESLPEEFAKNITQYSESLSGLLVSSNNAPELVRAMRCLITLKNIRNKLHGWLEHIVFNDGILIAPVVRGLILASYNENLSPFDLLYSKPKLNYRRRNIIIMLIALAVIFLVCKSAFMTYQVISDSKKEMSEFVENEKAARNTSQFSQMITEKSIDLIKHTENELKKSAWTSIYPSGYVLLPLKKQIADHIYDFILLPELGKTTSAEKTIFYIFLIKSGLSTSLTDYLLKNSNKISSELSIEQNIIEFFLKYNDERRSSHFMGATAFPNISDYYFGSQYRYLIDLYSNLSLSDTITISDVNKFLSYFYGYYNKKISIDLLLNKYYPLIRGSLESETRNFITQYQRFLNSKIIRDKQANRLINDIDVFSKTAYKVPEDLSFYRLLKAINEIAETALGDTDVKTISLKSQSGPLQVKSWPQVVAVAKINTLLRNYFSSTKSEEQLFSDNFKQLFLPITINPDNKGQFLYTGKYQVPGIFTKLAVKSAIIPTVKQFNNMLIKISRLGIKTDYLKYSFDQKLKEYVKSYSNSYVMLLDNFACNVNSPTELRFFLKNYSSPESPLLLLIDLVKTNTHFKITEDNKFMQPVVDKFEAYTKLKKKPKKDTIDSGSLNMYMSIIKSACSDVSVLQPPKNEKTSLLEPQIELSNLGRIAMKIALNDKDSYLNIVDAWLRNINMPDDLRGPFLKPIEQIYIFGSKDLRNKLDLVWKRQLLPMVNKYKMDYPFDRDAESTFDPDAFDQDFSPNGKFWTTFNMYFKPFMQKTGDKWRRKSILLDVPLVSRDTLKLIDEVFNLTATLFDSKGAPKTIQVEISAEPIYDLRSYEDTIIKMTSLTSGNQEVIGINSVPIWKEFSIKWWDPIVSQISIQMSDGSTFNSNQIEGVLSLFQLLDKADYDEKTGIFTWTITILGEQERTAKVSFKFKSDPRKAFSL